jgi:predicted anti-sigma-YlaC factor YlaD
MNCEISNDLIMKYFDGDINDIESAQLKQHLKTCGPCSTDFKNMSDIFGVLERGNPIEPPQNFEAQVMSKINAYEVEKRKRTDRSLGFLYTAACMMLLLLSVLLMIDINGIDVYRVAGRAGEAFSSLASLTLAVQSTVYALFTLAKGVFGALFQVAYLVYKTYSHIFFALAVMLVLLPGALTPAARQKHGGSK